MPNNKKETSLTPEKKQDVTGQKQFRSNLLYSWGGYLVVFIAGFLTPRLIDRNIGQVELGIWDFSWSFVSYMKLAMLGIGSSINRYVAKYRAAGDDEGLNRTVSTVVCLQGGIAATVLLLSFLLAWIVAVFFSDQFKEYTNIAQWTIILLGGSLAINMAFDTSRGVLTGYHRWDLHTTIAAVANALELIGMVTVLSLGGGLCSLGIVVICVALLSGLCRMYFVRRICPDLHVSPRLFHGNTAREMFRFGVKTLAIRSPLLILVQTTSIIIVSHLGPAALAVFARSLALVRHVEGFMSRFSFILAPTAGSLQGLDNEEQLRAFFLKTTRYGVAFAAPMFFFLIIDGDLIIRLWMGEQYVHGQTLIILSLGYFLPTAQNSVREILKGMNAHGKVGVLSFIICSCCFLAGFILLQKIGWSIDRAAIMLSVSLVGLGFAPPIYACRKLKTSYQDYLYHSILPPFLCNSVFIAGLLAGRLFFPASPIIAIGGGMTTGLLFLSFLYLRFIFLEEGRTLWKRFQKKRHPPASL
jgi:O-antigen/teichoic acid export membrane protein